jgi:hypothetical protein
MAKQAELEIHAYLDDLCKSGFYGELTFYFQNGDINNYRETVRSGKNELIEKYRATADRGNKKSVLLVSTKLPHGEGA